MIIRHRLHAVASRRMVSARRCGAMLFSVIAADAGVIVQLRYASGLYGCGRDTLVARPRTRYDAHDRLRCMHISSKHRFGRELQHFISPLLQRQVSELNVQSKYANKTNN